MSTTNTNPGNFANRPTEEVKAIASMGGKASHSGHTKTEDEACAVSLREDSAAPPGRNPDGTFIKGSEAAKAAGHVGGMHSHDHDHDGMAKEEKVSELEVQDDDHTGRRADGTFTKGSEAAKEAGHKGGLSHTSS
ncbi:hypothetical protein LTR17_011821 [Elasticomyces elasticus]|nr:hypothetical protein LTR17_011821 [Elasticomyces elasticus]